MKSEGEVTKKKLCSRDGITRLGRARNERVCPFWNAPARSIPESKANAACAVNTGQEEPFAVSVSQALQQMKWSLASLPLPADQGHAAADLPSPYGRTCAL